MTQDSPPPPDRDAAIARALAEYLAALEAGGPVDRAAFLAERADLGPDLEPLLASVEAVHAARRAVDAGAAGAAVPVPPFAPHTEVGEFEVVRVLGRGGMGVVYEAVQRPLGRRVALKVLPPDAADPAARRRFLHEARTAALLQHPHVVPVHAVGEAGGVPNYAMQYIDGPPLDAVVRALRRDAGLDPPDPDADPDPPSVAALVATGLTAGFAPPGGGPTAGSPGSDGYARRVAELGVQAADALAHAHEQGVVHRDVKPGNLLLDVRGHLWLADFGLARAGAAAGGTTGGRAGTLRYMAPERAAGGGGPADARADVYSLGATLYELLALRPAFAAANDAEFLRQVLAADPVPLRQVAPAVPEDLAKVVHKAMAREPADRYQAARELADDLGRFLAGLPVRARPLTRPQRLRRWARRRRRPLLLAAAALAVGVVAGLSASTYLVYRAYRAEAAERARAERRGELLRGVVDELSRSELLLRHIPDAQPRQRELVRRLKDTLCALADEPGAGADARLEAARACLRLSEAACRAGDFAADRAAAAEAAERVAPLLAADPDRREYRYEAGRAHRTLAGQRQAAGDPDGAAALGRVAVALFEGLARDDPGRAEYQNYLSEAYVHLVNYHLGRDEAGAAAAEQEKALRADRELARRYPDHPQSHIRLAASWANAARVRAAAGDPAGAEAALREAVRADGVLAARHPTPSTETRGESYVARGRLGTLLTARGAYDEARPLLRAVVADARHLADAYRATPAFRSQVAKWCFHLGELEYLAGRGAAARAAFAEMAAAQRALAEAGEADWAVAQREAVPVPGVFDPARVVADLRRTAGGAAVRPEWRAYVGVALTRAGRYPEAADELSAVAGGPPVPRALRGLALYALARCRALSGDRAAAAAAFAEAEGLEPLRYALDGGLRVARAEAEAAMREAGR